MKRFNFNGREMNFLELLPFSVVPAKTLRSRLFSGSSLWSVESALNTPFGEKGKIDEVSAGSSRVVEKRAKQPKPQTWEKPKREKETFYCVQCRTSKKTALLGYTYKNHNKVCAGCYEKMRKAVVISKQEKAIKDSHKKERKKAYSKYLSDTQLYFITRENR